MLRLKEVKIMEEEKILSQQQLIEDEQKSIIESVIDKIVQNEKSQNSTTKKLT